MMLQSLLPKCAHAQMRWSVKKRQAWLNLISSCKREASLSRSLAIEQPSTLVG